MNSQTYPRHFRATIITATAAAILPIALFLLAVYEFNSSDSSGDSGFAQGLVIFSLTFTVSLCVSTLGFPLVAAYLAKRDKLCGANMFIVISLVLVIVSFIAAAIASSFVGMPEAAAILTFIILIVASPLSLPFVPLWLKMARCA